MAELHDDDLAALLTQRPLHKFAINCMRNYGMEVIESRALPDLRDGLKPVQRRILYSMRHELHLRPNGGRVKSARVVGDVMGKFHPHGDMPIYEAMVNMTNTNTAVALLSGQGNWGRFNQRAAAARYTEITISDYAYRMLLDENYMAIVPTVPNYDEREQEPIFLPALLPNLLLNGVSGIAVGVAVNIPPFAVKGIARLLTIALQGEKITAKDCVRHLRITYPAPFNSVVLTPDTELLEFYKTGRGRLNLGVGYTTQDNKMTITQFPPHFNMDRAKISLLTKIPEVATAFNISDKNSDVMQITLKSSVSPLGRHEIFRRCADLLQEGITLNVNYIQRMDADKVIFTNSNLPDLLHNWLDWRVDLEVQMYRRLVEKLREEINRLRLMVLAHDNLDLLVNELKRKSDNLEQRVMQALKITEDQVKVILAFTVRQLSALSRSDTQNSIMERKTKVREYRRHIRRPKLKILADLPQLVLQMQDNK